MKVLAISAGVCAINSVMADDAGPRKLGQTKDILAEYLGMSPADTKDLLKGYGCYCYVQDQNAVGPAFSYNGEPLDELDALCKKLYRAQKCIDLDATAGNWNKNCDIMDSFKIYEDGNGGLTCEEPQGQDNTDRADCKLHMCYLELDFTGKIADLFNSGWDYQESMKGWSASDYQANCVKQPSNTGSNTELSCCGEGLERKTFNTMVNQCCNEEVTSIGSC